MQPRVAKNHGGFVDHVCFVFSSLLKSHDQDVVYKECRSCNYIDNMLKEITKTSTQGKINV